MEIENQPQNGAEESKSVRHSDKKQETLRAFHRCKAGTGERQSPPRRAPYRILS